MDEFTKSKVTELKKGVKSLQDQARNFKKNDNTQDLIEVILPNDRSQCTSPLTSSHFLPILTSIGSALHAVTQGCSMPTVTWPACCVQIVQQLNSVHNPGPLLQEAKKIGDSFLALEKYVNLNYLVRTACAQHAAVRQPLLST